jgi:F-type H+-transporting ATPase subunit epsilon
MRLDIVTPEKQLLSEEVDRVQIPGMEGDMTVLGDHAPLVTTLRPGILTVHGGSAGGATDYIVTGGFAEISSAGTSVLAEHAVLKSDADREFFEAALADAKEELEKSTQETRTAAALRVNDMNELLSRHVA